MPLKILLTLYQELSDCQILPLKRQELVLIYKLLYYDTSSCLVRLVQSKERPSSQRARTDTAPHDKDTNYAESLSRSLFLSPETHLSLVLVSGSSEQYIFP